MDSINQAIKLNIQYHFERFCANTNTDCSECPFKKECTSIDSHESRCLCEIITGKRMGELTNNNK